MILPTKRQILSFIEFFENKAEEMQDKIHREYSLELLGDLKQRCRNKEQDKEWELTSFQRWMELVRKWLKYVVAYSFSRNYTDTKGCDEGICL